MLAGGRYYAIRPRTEADLGRGVHHHPLQIPVVPAPVPVPTPHASGTCGQNRWGPGATGGRRHPPRRPHLALRSPAAHFFRNPKPGPATSSTPRLPEPNQALPPSPLLRVLGWGATEANALSDALRKTDVAPLDSKERWGGAVWEGQGRGELAGLARPRAMVATRPCVWL